MSESDNEFAEEDSVREEDSESEIEDGQYQESEEEGEELENQQVEETASTVESEVQFNFKTPHISNEGEAATFLVTNPHLGNLFKKMIKEGIQEETHLMKKGNPQQYKTPVKQSRPGQGTPIKSPSDTTIYTPALSRMDPIEGQNHIIDKISNFVEGIRIETDKRRGSPASTSVRDKDRQEATMSRGEQPPEDEEPDRTNKLLIEAEQFKVAVEPPRGNANHTNSSPGPSGVKRGEFDVEDNEFFHLTCHIDGAVKAKIEGGEFVELEKLLPKRRNFKGDDSHLEWVSRDRMTFLAPAQDWDLKINSIKRWDQAFRVYAAIYCNANRERSGEVWQYIYVIHSAAGSYQWDNMAYYDYTFRQLMAQKPHRSWAKTYVQLWYLALRDPINRGGSSWNNYGNSRGHGSGLGGSTEGKQKHKDWHDNCCWQFNRTGRCDRPGCKFDNHCSYCGMWNNHGSSSCRKKANGGKNDNSPKNRKK